MRHMVTPRVCQLSLSSQHVLLRRWRVGLKSGLYLGRGISPFWRGKKVKRWCIGKENMSQRTCRNGTRNIWSRQEYINCDFHHTCLNKHVVIVHSPRFCRIVCRCGSKFYLKMLVYRSEQSWDKLRTLHGRRQQNV